MNESNRNESMQYYSFTAVTKSIALAAFAAASMIGGANLAQQLVTPLVRLLSASSSSNSSDISATTRSAYLSSSQYLITGAALTAQPLL